MKKCPRCRSERTRLSKLDGFLESNVLKLFLIKPFRCTACRKRFYRFTTVEAKYRKVKRRKQLELELDDSQTSRPERGDFEDLVAEIREAESVLKAKAAAAPDEEDQLKVRPFPKTAGK